MTVRSSSECLGKISPLSTLEGFDNLWAPWSVSDWCPGLGPSHRWDWVVCALAGPGDGSCMEMTCVPETHCQRGLESLREGQGHGSHEHCRGSASALWVVTTIHTPLWNVGQFYPDSGIRGGA